jgi:hypothetical protein
MAERKPSRPAVLQRVAVWGFGPVSGTRLEVFRWATAWSLMIYTLAWSASAGEWLSTAGFHPDHVASLGLQLPVPLLPEALVPVFLGLYLGAIAGIIVGFRPRLCSMVVLLGLVYVTYADRLAAFTMNKIFLATWLVLVLAPLHRRAQEESGVRSELRSAWPLRVLQATLVLQYFGAGICKVRGDWLDHSDTLWTQAQLLYMTDMAAWTVRVFPMDVWAGFQWSALAFELLAPLLFLVRRLRPVAFIWGGGMHLMIGLLMYQVGYFSIQIVAFYVLFADERWLRWWTRWTTPTSPTT